MKRHFMRIVIQLTVFISVIKDQYCQIPYRSKFDGSCPSIEDQLNGTVDFKKLSGHWYEYARFGFPAQAKCVQAEYKYVDDTTIDMAYKGKRYRKFIEDTRELPVLDWRRNRKFTTPWLYSNGTATVMESKIPQKLQTRFNVDSSTLLMTVFPNPVYLAAFDYDRYLVYWACSPMEDVDLHIEYAIMYTRKPVLVEESWEDYYTKENMYKASRKLGIFITKLHFVKQDECD